MLHSQISPADLTGGVEHSCARWRWGPEEFAIRGEFQWNRDPTGDCQLVPGWL